jgi:hypothetical protein
MGRSKNKLKPMLFYQPAQTETCDISLLLHNSTVEPDEWVQHYLKRGGDPSAIGHRPMPSTLIGCDSDCFITHDEAINSSITRFNEHVIDLGHHLFT